MHSEITYTQVQAILVFFFTLLVHSGCSDSDIESERSRVVRLLTNNLSKDWVVESVDYDEVPQLISSCDSSYVLTLKSDFTWEEIYLKVACYQNNQGYWSLNDENNMITIKYPDQFTAKQVEREFELVELSDDYFSYQFIQNDAIKRIRLKKR